MNHPPKWADRFLRWYCKPELLEEIQGDAYELYFERLDSQGKRHADRKYIFDVLRFCRWSNIKKVNSKYQSNKVPVSMVKNFYFTAVRNLLRHKSYFMINISGLAIGIASFTFIALYIINELSYDRFHANHKKTYRVSNHAIIRGEPNRDATTSAPMAKTLLARYPEVLKATRLLKSGPLLVGKGGRKINEEGVLYADAPFFEVFDFKLLKGNPKTALVHPRSMVLTRSYANKYFGTDDPMGQQITVDEDSIFYTITGIADDIPANSHIKFDMLGSMSTNDAWNSNRWVGTSQHTYVILNESTEVAALEEKMRDIFYDHMAKEIEFYTGLSMAEWEGAGNSVRFKLTPLKDIHLYSTSTGELEPTGNIRYIRIYGIIGLIILFIAIFNFVNLATAHSTSRAREVGVRKVIGSTKRNLVFQFIFESVIVSMIAMFIAVVLVTSLTPSFVDLMGKGLAYGLTSHYIGWISIIGFAIIVGVIAGCYPAFVLSAFRPVDVLKGALKTGAKAGWLRNLLVTLQFAASIVIIIGTLAIYHQIDFMLTKNLGFDKEQILVVKRSDWLKSPMDVFKNDLLKNPDIQAVANSETIPGKPYKIRSYRRKDDPETFLFLNNQVTYDYLQIMGLKLISGRFFSKEFSADSNAVVLNESAAKAFGWEDAVGKTLTSAFKKGRPLTVIGVVKDYNIESLHKKVAPVSLELAPEVNDYLTIKMSNSRNIRKTVQSVEDTWHQYSGDKPFQYFFFDEDYERLYRTESRTGRVLMVFATLSILIASMGLIGLITYAASNRKKEIGIRKVLGASVANLITLLSGETVRLIVIAVVISWPFAYFATEYWLQNFADRITINPWTYLIATLAIVLIVGFAISFQTFRAATGNPSDSLRDE